MRVKTILDNMWIELPSIVIRYFDIYRIVLRLDTRSTLVTMLKIQNFQTPWMMPRNQNPSSHWMTKSHNHLHSASLPANYSMKIIEKTE